MKPRDWADVALRHWPLGMVVGGSLMVLGLGWTMILAGLIAFGLGEVDAMRAAMKRDAQ